MRCSCATAHLIALALLLCCASAAIAVFDDFEELGAWKGPVFEYGDATTGDAWIRDSVLGVRHRPVGRWHTVSMQREWPVEFHWNTWIHFRFRLPEILLGADLYFTAQRGDTVLIQWGVNGEQHWVQGGQCEAKTWDDEFFWGSPLIIGEADGKNTDIRTGLPDALRGKVRYTDWTLVSIKFEETKDQRRVRVFVEGLEVPLRDLDAAFPNGVIDNRVKENFQPPAETTPLRITCANFADGDLYADTAVNAGAGVRWLHAFAEMTPALPHATDPKQAVQKDSVMEWDYVIVVDEAETPALYTKMEALAAAGRLDRAAAERVGLLPTKGLVQCSGHSRSP